MDQSTCLVTSGPRGWAKFYADSGPVFIRAQNINTDKLRLEDIARVQPPNNAEGLRTRVHLGDLLITITGANVTKAALVDVDLDEAYVSQHVALTRLVDPVVGKLVPTEAELARREGRPYEPAGVLLGRIREEKERARYERNSRPRKAKR